MKPIQLREADFKREIETFSYPKEMKEEFFQYWSEPNKSGTKMRFETEKTWHLGRRLARWANNGFESIKTPQKKEAVKQPQKAPETEIEKLDYDLELFRRTPSNYPFEKFGKWYDLLKSNKLFKPFTKEDIYWIQQTYGSDNYKCRCAAVYETFKYFGDRFNFSDLLKARNGL